MMDPDRAPGDFLQGVVHWDGLWFVYWCESKVQQPVRLKNENKISGSYKIVIVFKIFI